MFDILLLVAFLALKIGIFPLKFSCLEFLLLELILVSCFMFLGIIWLRYGMKWSKEMGKNWPRKCVILREQKENLHWFGTSCHKMRQLDWNKIESLEWVVTSCGNEFPVIQWPNKNSEGLGTSCHILWQRTLKSGKLKITNLEREKDFRNDGMTLIWK